jgi:hypothetical protein
VSGYLLRNDTEVYGASHSDFEATYEVVAGGTPNFGSRN